MKSTFFPVPSNEKNRLKALYQYDLLDSLSEKEYDFITNVATQVCDTQASLITLLDEKKTVCKVLFWI